jgi:hypothetical protein
MPPSSDAIYAYYTKNSPVREGLEELRRVAAANHLRGAGPDLPHAYGAHADPNGTPLPELSEYPNSWVFDNTRVLGLCRELGFTCIDLAGRLFEKPKLRVLPSGACSATVAATSASSAQGHGVGRVQRARRRAGWLRR